MIPTTLGLSTILATSTSSTMSRFPTVSPNTNGAYNSAYFSELSGEIVYGIHQYINIGNFYGSTSPISPDTYSYSTAWYVPSSGLIDVYGTEFVEYSYGINLRRTRDGTMLLVLSALLVTSTAATTAMSTVPTDYSKSSPNSRVDYTSYILLPDGSSNDYDVYQVYSSYGII